MKFRPVVFVCAISMLIAMPSFAAAAINSQMGGPLHTSRDRQCMSKNTQPLWIVKAIQNKLKSEGYDVGRVDGIWGKNTSAALRTYQTAHGIQASGKVNQETAYLLGLDNNELATFQEETAQLSSYQDNS